MRFTIVSALLALALAQPALAQSAYTLAGVTAQPGTTVSGELQVPAGVEAEELAVQHVR